MVEVFVVWNAGGDC